MFRLFLAAAALCITLPLNAAAPTSIVGPEYIGAFEGVVSGVRLPLERVMIENKLKLAAMGLGGGSQVLRAPGERSPLRLQRGVTVEFVVHVESQQVDPNEQIGFYRMTSKKGWREVKTTNYGAFRGPSSTVAQYAVPFSAVKLGSSYFRITAVGELPAGEYLLKINRRDINAFALQASDAGYLFGID